MRVERSIEIGTAPDDVYALVMDTQRLGDWVTIHDGLDGSSADNLRIGSTLTQRLKVAGTRFSVDWRITQADRPRCVVWEGAGPARTSARVEYGFQQRGDAATRFSYFNEYELPGGAAGRLAGRAVSGVAEREMRRSLERLKALLER